MRACVAALGGDDASEPMGSNSRRDWHHPSDWMHAGFDLGDPIPDGRGGALGSRSHRGPTCWCCFWVGAKTGIPASDTTAVNRGHIVRQAHGGERSHRTLGRRPRSGPPPPAAAGRRPSAPGSAGGRCPRCHGWPALGYSPGGLAKRRTLRAHEPRRLAEVLLAPSLHPGERDDRLKAAYRVRGMSRFEGVPVPRPCTRLHGQPADHLLAVDRILRVVLLQRHLEASGRGAPLPGAHPVLVVLRLHLGQHRRRAREVLREAHHHPHIRHPAAHRSTAAATTPAGPRAHDMTTSEFRRVATCLLLPGR